MSRHNRNFSQPTSQRPAHQQVSTRPAVAEEAPLDTQRVPSAATDAQSQADAEAADPDRYEAQPDITGTDALPAEPTDTVSVEEADADAADEADFGGFEDIGVRGPKSVATKDSGAQRVIQAPVVIHRDAVEEAAFQNELVAIVPRKTQQRNFINNTNYALVKGQEQFVPRSVADHFRDKGLI